MSETTTPAMRPESESFEQREYWDFHNLESDRPGCYLFWPAICGREGLSPGPNGHAHDHAIAAEERGRDVVWVGVPSGYEGVPFGIGRLLSR